MPDSRLLVLDDDPETCHVVKNVAENLGFSVVVPSPPYGDGFASIRPNVVFLDLLLPDRQGIDAIKRLGDAGSDAQIVLTGGPDRRTLKSAKRLAAKCGLRIVGALSTPIRYDVLAATLKRLCGANSLPDEAELAHAVAAGELTVHYQPKVTALGRTGWQLDSLEALVRWEHPRLGRLNPDMFIPLAERTGLIVGLTEQVIEIVLEQLSEWQELGLAVPVAVNLSARVVDDLSLPDRLAQSLGARSIDSRLLILEITESSAIIDTTCALDVLSRLRLKGFQLSVDDFGTGHSSLVQLHHIPFTELKIDQEFVHDLPDDTISAHIVRGIIELARALDLTVCVEGVETEAAFAMMRDLGCDLFQGYHFAAALPGAAVTRLLAGQAEMANPTAVDRGERATERHQAFGVQPCEVGF